MYAVDFNHKKERHLNGALFNNIIRPSLLITDAYNATFEYKKRRKRDQELSEFSILSFIMFYLFRFYLFVSLN